MSSSPNLKIIAFSNIEDAGSMNYVSSLKKFGYNYTILGKGVKWRGFVKTKIKHIYRYLISQYSTRDINKTDIICITDVNDVLACCYPNEVISKFLGFNCDLVIGSEDPYLPVICVKEQRNKYPKHIKRVYCNGGFYIGYPHAIIRMYEYVLSLGLNDDQLCIGLYNVHNTGHELDIKSKLVYNIALEPYEFKDNRVYCPYSKELPCFVHMIGKLSMNSISNVILNGRYEKISLRDVTFHNLGKLRCYFRTYFHKLQLYVVIIGLVIFGISHLLYESHVSISLISMYIIIILYLLI